MVFNLIREPNYQSSLTIAKAWRLQASKMRNMVTPALEHQKGNSLSFTLESVLNIVVLLLGPCNYLITGTFNFDRISFPFSLTVLAQDVLFQPLFYLYTSH